MKTVLISSSIAIVLPFTADVQANSAVTDWEAAREKITDETVLDLRECPHYRYLPPEKFSLFVRCVTEKRIQPAKRFGCSWTEDRRTTIGEAFDHLVAARSHGTERTWSGPSSKLHRKFCRQVRIGIGDPCEARPADR
jgi:hypothetical protein